MMHADCVAYLEALRALQMPAGTPEEVRARYRAQCALWAGERVDVGTSEVACGRVYGAGGPLLVWFHGGRMVSGDLETHDALCRGLAAASGWRVMGVDYRLAPEHRHPAQLEDARAALRWAATMSERVAVGGDSAGATLALVTAMERVIDLEALVLVYPMLDATQEHASHAEFAEGPGTSARDIRLGYEWWLGESADRRDWRVSPRFGDGWEALPPAFVLTCGVDPLRDEGIELAGRLSGVVHEHYADHLHGFMTYPGRFQAAQTASGQIARFLNCRGR